MKISSLDFKPNEMIPKKFTCIGEGINPNLIIEDIPQDAKTLALIIDDPDAVSGTFVHWVMFNIPITNKIKQNSAIGIEGLNDAGTKGYIAPCPPEGTGTHRYFFKIYALDCKLNLKENSSKTDLEEKMEGHILDQAQIIGLFTKD